MFPLQKIFHLLDWVIMNSVVLELLLCFGFILLAFALFQSHRGWVRRMGGLVLVATSGLALWFWTRSWAIVVAGMSMWVVLPVAQAAYLSRHLKFSMGRKLKPSSFTHEEFPDVHEITSEMRNQGFSLCGDFWLDPSPVEQGYRVFVHEKDKTYGAIAVVRHGPAVLSYLIFVSKDKDGTTWITWDYPLAYGLQMPPDFMIYRCQEADSIEQLYRQHLDFLVLNDVNVAEVSNEKAAEFFDELFLSMIHYNISKGVLASMREDGEINYTWRGTLFVSWQVLREVVLG